MLALQSLRLAPECTLAMSFGLAPRPIPDPLLTERYRLPFLAAVDVGLLYHPRALMQRPGFLHLTVEDGVWTRRVRQEPMVEPPEGSSG